ncbi:MAG: DsbA family oxidoreductase [Flammeovirgaceae bacterium]|jgi:predicted DsbA family dithiol-disulfide isomerase|nr:DsbA family oxidoreductase [Flammeovirgaceae bacterium]
MTNPKIKIDVVSDVVCPWCYIGKRRLEKAIAQVADQVDVELEYHPFELNPDMPLEGRNQKEYLTRKFGSEVKYQQIVEHVTDVAAQEGLKFDFEKQVISPNTRNAHRLIWFAKKHGKQIEMKEALMKAYFEQGIDLTKMENLISIATQAGIDPEKIKSFLSSTEGMVEVTTSEMQNAQRGISGVPFYIINNQYGVSGAQPSEVFARALLEISAENTTAGEACDIESKEC